MDKKTLVEIINSGIEWDGEDDLRMIAPSLMAERILAALEKEREGEVVLWPVTKEDKVLIRVTNEPSDKYKHFTGVSGKLVFIPEAK